jgi:hypothetical protein
LFEVAFLDLLVTTILSRSSRESLSLGRLLLRRQDLGALEALVKICQLLIGGLADRMRLDDVVEALLAFLGLVRGLFDDEGDRTTSRIREGCWRFPLWGARARVRAGYRNSCYQLDET